MNRWILACCFLISFAQAQKTFDFTIKGTIKNKTGNKIVLEYADQQQVFTDSVIIVKDAYSFSGSLSEPVLAKLSIDTSFYILHLDEGTIKIETKGALPASIVKGNKAHDSYLAFNKVIQPYSDTMQQLIAKYTEASSGGNQAVMSEIQQKGVALETTIREQVMVPFLEKYPQSPTSLMLLKQYAQNNSNFERVEELYGKLDQSVQQYPSAVAFMQQYLSVKRTSIGQKATDFTQNDPNGVPIKLSSYRGKYVLLDFWASWCGPCRVENPHIVNAYHKFKDKGFDILGVSLDREGARAAWLAAIEKDGLVWTNVSDLKFWKNEAALLYGVQSIPQNYLIDPEGKIIAKNLRGQELQAMLEDILNPK